MLYSVTFFQIYPILFFQYIFSLNSAPRELKGFSQYPYCKKSNTWLMVFEVWAGGQRRVGEGKNPVIISAGPLNQ